MLPLTRIFATHVPPKHDDGLLIRFIEIPAVVGLPVLGPSIMPPVVAAAVSQQGEIPPQSVTWTESSRNFPFQEFPMTADAEFAGVRLTARAEESPAEAPHPEVRQVDPADEAM